MKAGGDKGPLVSRGEHGGCAEEEEEEEAEEEEEGEEEEEVSCEGVKEALLLYSSSIRKRKETALGAAVKSQAMKPRQRK